MASDRDIERAVEILRAGGLVAFPTETVYGLGADASNAAAVRKIFAAKGRPHDHPLIVHIADAIQMAAWASDIPKHAHLLAQRFWPGPLTLVLQQAADVSDLITGRQKTIALRAPVHPVARALLARFGGGIAAPSANRYGRVSATTAEHVRREFGDEIDCILDGGATDLGIESTIVDLSGATPSVLRCGVITEGMLEEALGVPLAAPGRASPRAPGTHERHYAPQTPLMVMEPDLLLELASSLSRQGKRVAVLARSAKQPLLSGMTWIGAPSNPAGYAHDLYANLRLLDEAGCDAILAEAPPTDMEWAAIRDRLTRASAGGMPPEAT
ncbi:MAG TPA: L-threonylcarbamoyladenylate synthase [Burkholderiales bacterium]|nr:L-threonylcarbamoyladenylate synthase [Burkholderiales bacterium]